MKSIIAIAAILVAGGVGYAMWPASPQSADSEAAISLEGGVLADVLLPEALSQNAQIGQLGFEAKCAACHGLNAAGQDGVAPPLSTSFMSRATTVTKRSNGLLLWAFGDITGRLVTCHPLRA